MDLQSQLRAGIVRDQDIMLIFPEHQSHPPILEKHLGVVEGFQTPISEFSADVSLKSSNCVNFSEDFSCEKLSLFFFFKFDIKHGYHHVNIDKAYHKYLSFSWSENGITKYYVFTVLVFGLATVPFVFTKMVKVLVGYWRGCGIRIFSFIDDFFGGASTFHQTAITAAKVKKDLELSGFVANVKKSQWHPSQAGMHLGFFVDLKNGIFSVLKSRVDKLKDLLRQLHGKAHTMARCLARVVVTIISMGLGIGPVSRMWMRRLYANLNQALAWDRPLALAPATLKELEFWDNCFEKFNGQPIWTVNPICSLTSYSDSSEYGWGDTQ